MTKTENLRKRTEPKIKAIDAQWLKYGAIELIDDYEETEERDIDMIIRVENGETIATEE